MIALVLMPLLLVALVACSKDIATTAATCAFVVGDGKNGRTANLEDILYPGEHKSVDDTMVIEFVPCNSRNYIINDGTVTNANGDKVGDRGQMISATTDKGTPILIAARAMWTLNQDEKALRNFYTVCHKYHCSMTADQAGQANYASPGWNGLLAENFGTAMDDVGRTAAKKVGETIWQTRDATEYGKLEKEMSALFADAIRKNLGFPEDLFCGSGNSQWSDPKNPGQGTFECSDVRIVVEEVRRGDIASDSNAAGVLEINAQRLLNAQAQYGAASAGFWLGLQDTIDKCFASARAHGIADPKCGELASLGLNPPAAALPASPPGPTPSAQPSPSASPSPR
jgi:hypothetical protein